MRVNLLVNVHRADAVVAAKRARDFLQKRGVTVGADLDAGPVLGVEAIKADLFGECDLAVTFGGDGTLIRAAHACSNRGTPILGVYYGTFGFVTQCLGSDLLDCLQRFLDGKADIESRQMLQTDLMRNGKPLVTIHALNEIVVQRAVTARMLTLKVQVDGNELTSYPADGVIVSTATGSTGYNLSAGGPVMDPGVDAFVLTALAPHTLSARPLVLKTTSVIQLSMETAGEAVLSADSQSRLHVLSGDQVRIRRSDRVTRLMTVQRSDFLVKLSERLFWSQSLLGEMKDE